MRDMQRENDGPALRGPSAGERGPRSPLGAPPVQSMLFGTGDQHGGVEGEPQLGCRNQGECQAPSLSKLLAGLGYKTERCSKWRITSKKNILKGAEVVLESCNAAEVWAWLRRTEQWTG